MEKLYSKRSLLIKSTFCFLLPLAQQLFFSRTLLALFASFVALGCLYTIPFRLTLSKLIKGDGSFAWKYVVLDICSCFVPAVASALLYEAYVEMFVLPSALNGLYTLLLAVILLLISGIFVLLYKFAGRHNRP